MARAGWYSDHPPACTCATCSAARLEREIRRTADTRANNRRNITSAKSTKKKSKAKRKKKKK